MKLIIKLVPILMIISVSSTFSQSKVYEVNNIKDKIIITGSGSDALWKEANILTDFSYPWQNKQAPSTKFKALWSETYFYFLFEVDDDDIITPKRGKGEHDTLKSDRVEIFFRSNDITKPYYSLEMDALSRCLDTEGIFYDKVDFKWNWPKEEFVLKAIKRKGGYTLEGSITLESLRQLDIYKDDGFLHAGLYRGEYFHNSNEEIEVNWISWVIPDSKNFHVPSSFGVLKLNTDE